MIHVLLKVMKSVVDKSDPSLDQQLIQAPKAPGLVTEFPSRGWNSETTLFLFLFVLTRTLHYTHHTTHYARASMERRQSLFQDKGTDRLQRGVGWGDQSSNHLEGELITRFTGSTDREEFPSGRHHHLSAEVLLRMRREVGGLPKRVLVERITRNAQPPFGRRHYRLAVIP